MNWQDDLSVTRLLGAERNAVREQGEPSERVKRLDNDAAVMFRLRLNYENPTKGEPKGLQSIKF